MSGHPYLAPLPGVGSLPCARCGRSRRSHLVPVAPGTRLSHGELIEAMGRCDGRCGRCGGRPYSHNELVLLHGRCDGRCGYGHK